MKTNTSHLQAAPTNDLLNLPDIDGVFPHRLLSQC